MSDAALERLTCDLIHAAYAIVVTFAAYAAYLLIGAQS